MVTADYINFLVLARSKKKFTEVTVTCCHIVSGIFRPTFPLDFVFEFLLVSVIRESACEAIPKAQRSSDLNDCCPRQGKQTTLSAEMRLALTRVRRVLASVTVQGSWRTGYRRPLRRNAEYHCKGSTLDVSLKTPKKIVKVSNPVPGGPGVIALDRARRYVRQRKAKFDTIGQLVFLYDAAVRARVGRSQGHGSEMLVSEFCGLDAFPGRPVLPPSPAVLARLRPYRGPVRAAGE